MKVASKTLSRLPENYKSAVLGITEILKRSYKPEKIILYGSCKEGEVDENSDIDMLIIKNTKKKKFIDRWMEVQKLIKEENNRIPFEPLIFTSEEIKKALKEGNQFIQDIIKKGEVLYEKSC
ncbi:MAG: nucleotidyltransferase domain-containing protein [Candidatus Thermoplasmatota archaeon]